GGAHADGIPALDRDAVADEVIGVLSVEHRRYAVTAEDDAATVGDDRDGGGLEHREHEVQQVARFHDIPGQVRETRVDRPARAARLLEDDALALARVRAAVDRRTAVDADDGDRAVSRRGRLLA